MSFIESPRFPECISYGAIGGPGYNTSVIVVKSGAESRNAEWSAARHRYEVSQAAKTKSDFDAVSSFFRVAKGRANGFRFKDFADFQCKLEDGTLGFGNGTPGPYQMVKKYASGSNLSLRTITKPVVGTVSVMRGGVPLTVGTDPGNISIDYTTGTISFVPDEAEAVLDITVGVTTDIELADNPGSLIAGQHIYLTGFTGADAAVLNDKSHKINSVSGSGPYVFNLDVNTAGDTITISSDTFAEKYPQANEELTWQGEFDVPCRFDTDELRAEIVGPGPIIRWEGIPIVEIRV